MYIKTINPYISRQYNIFKGDSERINEPKNLKPSLDTDVTELKNANDEEKNNKNTFLLGGSVILASVLALAYLLKGKGLHINGYQSKTLEDSVFGGFKSLKDDNSVPTLENCKSISDKLRNLLRNQVILSKASPEDMRKLGVSNISKKILLCGPAGVGKTHYARIYAKTLNADYMEVSYGDMNSRYTGDHIEKIKSVFEEIIKTANANRDKQYVVTFNEIDAIIVPHQGLVESGGGHITFKKEERNLFLNYLDEISRKTTNLTIIGTTNSMPHKSTLDEAALSRFGTKINVDYPDKKCLYEALKASLSEITEEDFVIKNDKKIDDLAEKLYNRKASFRNLNDILENAKQSRLNQYIETGETKFKFEYLEKAEKACEVTDGEASGAAKAA